MSESSEPQHFFTITPLGASAEKVATEWKSAGAAISTELYADGTVHVAGDDFVETVGALLDDVTLRHTGHSLGALASEAIAADVIKQLHDCGIVLTAGQANE